jgi:ketol-acid reductoisomerase
MKVWRSEDVEPEALRGRRVAILGYGNQGRAQALNLRDTGIAVHVGLPEGARRRGQALEDGFDVMTPPEAAAGCDVAMILVPDEAQGALWREIEPALRQGAAAGFSHGFAIRFGRIVPRADLDIFLVAPKGPGSALRSEYEQGRGLTALLAIHQDASGGALRLALAYAGAIGCARAGILPTSFAEECEADLFNEQAVLWGAVPELILAGYETLVEAGFAPEIAFLECQTELKLLADLIDARGIAGMREAISNTAEYGAVAGGPRIVTAETRAEMRRILAEVRSGRFADALDADASAGYPRLSAARAQGASHPIEDVRAKLLAMKDEQAK